MLLFKQYPLIRFKVHIIVTLSLFKKRRKSHISSAEATKPVGDSVNEQILWIQALRFEIILTAVLEIKWLSNDGTQHTKHSKSFNRDILLAHYHHVLRGEPWKTVHERKRTQILYFFFTLCSTRLDDNTTWWSDDNDNIFLSGQAHAIFIGMIYKYNICFPTTCFPSRVVR